MMKSKDIRFMKPLLFITTFLFVFMFPAKAQVTVSQEYLDDSVKAFRLVVEQRDAIAKLQAQIEALNKVIEEQNRSKQTPCTVTQEKVKADALFWLDKYEKSDDATKKQIEKAFRQTLKLGSKSIQSQCGFTEKSAWSSVWETVKAAASVAAAAAVIAK